MQFFLQNTQNEIFKIFRMLKKTMKFTKATETKTPHSVVDIAGLTGWAKPGEIWKLNIWIWIYLKKVFISCVWLIPISWVCTTSKPFRYRYFIVFNQVGNRQYFQLVEKKKWFAWEHAKKVVEGLGTVWFVTVINLAPHSCGCGKILRK